MTITKKVILAPVFEDWFGNHSNEKINIRKTFSDLIYFFDVRIGRERERERERETETERDRDRETDRKAGRQADIQADRQTERQTYRHTYR
jgi:hypothetical protein